MLVITFYWESLWGAQNIKALLNRNPHQTDFLLIFGFRVHFNLEMIFVCLFGRTLFRLLSQFTENWIWILIFPAFQCSFLLKLFVCQRIFMSHFYDKANMLSVIFFLLFYFFYFWFFMLGWVLGWCWVEILYYELFFPFFEIKRFILFLEKGLISNHYYTPTSFRTKYRTKWHRKHRKVIKRMGDLCAVAVLVDSGGKQKGSCANLNVLEQKPKKGSQIELA